MKTGLFYHGIAAFFLFFLLFVPCAMASAPEGNLPTPIEDPVFLLSPSIPTDIAGQSGLSLYFSYDEDKCRAQYNENYYKGCQPRLGLSGKKIMAGVSISPEIAGEWRWAGDYNIVFTPSGYWLAGQAYSVSIDLDALDVPENVTVTGQRRLQTNFTTKPLEAEVKDMTYMQDPADPQRKLVTATVKLNYPVDAKALRSSFKTEREEGATGQGLSTKDSSVPLEFVPEADDTGNVSKIRSARVTAPVGDLPTGESYLRLIVGKGLAPVYGGQVSAADFTERVRIPTLTDYLTISDSAVIFARAEEDGKPQQLLSFSTNVKAAPDDMQGAVKAYLLPLHHPVMARSAKSKDDLSAYEWETTGEVTPDILKESEPVSISAMKDKEQATQFGFPVSVPEGRYIYLSVTQGAKAFGGYTLGKTFNTIVKVPDWPHDIDLMQKGSILPMTGSHKVGIHARGTDKITVEIAQVHADALQHLVSQTQGDIANPSFINWNFNADNISRLDTKDIPMTFRNQAESQYASFDFSPYLTKGEKGLFLLRMNGSRDGKETGWNAQRLVLVTDMGLLLKEGANKSRDIFLVSFATGEAVSGADIEILGKSGVAVFRGKTDKDGHIALPDLTSAVADKQPVAITARKGADYSFIPYDRAERTLNLSRFDTGGLTTPEQGMNGFLFTDRGIYRPGESVSLGMIVRNADWSKLPSDLPLRLVITAPRNKTVQDTVIKFSGAGLQEFNLKTEESWAIGTYNADLYIANDGEPSGRLGGTSFRVEDFEPDRLRLATEFSSARKGWLSPDKLSAIATLQNLYGTPASERRIETKVTLNPATIYFDSMKEYSFYDSYPGRRRQIDYKLPDTKTGADGKATISLDLEHQSKSAYNLELEIRGYEAGSGRGIASYNSALVSPAPYMIGHKLPDNPLYLVKGKTYAARLVAVDPDLRAMELDKLTLELVKKTYSSSLVKRDDGSYAYESVPHETSVSTVPFQIGADGSDLSLPTTETGEFSFRVKDKDGRVVDEIGFAVAGEKSKEDGADRESILDLRINKQEYKAGEDIEINITAPYTGSGLITIESDRVHAYKWFKTDKTSTIQKIRVPESFSGKGYVSVAFVRDINSHEIYMKPLSHAVVPFVANTAAHSLTIDLNVPDKVKPGKEVTIGYKGSAKGKVIIYAIDEGILSVAKYKTPDPVDYFLLNRALQVRTQQMLDLLMPEYDLVRQLSATGGDDDLSSSLRGKLANPFRRKTLAPAVMWSGIVDLDVSEKTVSFTPPDYFNGEMRVMAVAVSDAAVGSASVPVTVQDDLVLTPQIPLFMAPGDTATGSLTLANNIAPATEGGKTATIRLSSEGTAAFTVTDLPAEISVAAGEEKTVSFTLKAGDNPGPQELKIKASLDKTVRTSTATFAIRPAAARETTLTSGYSEDGKGSLSVSRSLFNESGSKQLSVSPLPSAYISSLSRYLDGFPYGCSEQLLSKATPQLSLLHSEGREQDAEMMRGKINDALASLRQRQTTEWGFSLWGGSDEPEPYVSIYALDFMTIAEDEHLSVASESVGNGLRYIRNVVNEDITSSDDARMKAYGTYILTRNGIVTTNEILHILKYFDDKKDTSWQRDLTAAYLAASYQMMQQTEPANKTIAEFEAGLNISEMSQKNFRSGDEWYDPLIRNARYISIMARHFPERLAKLDKSVIFSIAQSISQESYNTISAAYAIQALRDYEEKEAGRLSGTRYSVTVDGKKTAYTANSEPLDLALDAKDIRIESDTRAAVFYTISESGYDRTPSIEPVALNMDIVRTYAYPDGTPVTKEVKLGDVIDATVTVKSHGNRSIGNVAVVDLLPGGFDVEKEKGASPGSFSVVEKREDRVIAFGTIRPGGTVLRYKLRATSKGTFTVPAPFAESMYDLSTKTRGQGGEKLTVSDKQ